MEQRGNLRVLRKKFKESKKAIFLAFLLCQGWIEEKGKNNKSTQKNNQKIKKDNKKC